MKLRIFLLFTLICSAYSNAFSQVTEDEKSMSVGLRNAIILEIPDVEEKFVEKLWKKYIKTYGGKTKKVKRTNEYMTENASIASIGRGEGLLLYTRVDELGQDVELNLWVDLGEEFVSSTVYPSKYTESEKLLMRFALFVAKESTRLELEDEEKQLKRLKSTLKKLQRDNDRYHREIEQAKERIAKAEQNIDTNVVEQDETQKLIELQKEAVQLVKKRLSEL